MVAIQTATLLLEVMEGMTKANLHCILSPIILDQDQRLCRTITTWHMAREAVRLVLQGLNRHLLWQVLMMVLQLDKQSKWMAPLAAVVLPPHLKASPTSMDH